MIRNVRTLFFLSVTVIAALALSACGAAATPAVTAAPPATDVPMATAVPTDVPAVTVEPTVVPATTEAPAATAETTASVTIAGCTLAGFDPSAMLAAGQEVFANTCAGCHGNQAQGQGDYPSLVGDDLTKAPAEVAREFLNPKYHPFLANMTVDEIASVLSYVRQSFGNNASVICPEDLSGLLP